MSIDWLTVGAQVVNFLVLVWLLHRFLYHPVIDAMDRREERIGRRLREAEERESAAEEAARQYRAKEEALEAERGQRLEAAEEEAQQRRQALLAEAREEVRRAREQWRADLDREQDAFRREMGRAAAEAVGRISRRVLGDLADTALEDRMVARFLAELEGLDEDERQALAGAEHLTVRTAFEAGEERRARLRDGVRQRLGSEAEVTVATSDRLLCGIEVSAGGYTAGWSVDQYLTDLEEVLGEELAKPGSGAAVPAGAET